MEDNFLFMDSMVSYLLQCKLSVPFSFNVHSSVTSQIDTLLGAKYECDPLEDDFSPSSFLSAFVTCFGLREKLLFKTV